MLPAGLVLLAIAPSVKVSKVKAFESPVPATPPANVSKVKSIVAPEPVKTVTPLRAVPSAPEEAEIVKVVLSKDEEIKSILAEETDPDRAAFNSFERFSTVPAAVEPVLKKYKFPSTSSCGIGSAEAINL